MHTRVIPKIIFSVLLAFFCAGVVFTHADTITGDLYTNPVSISLPTPIDISSGPVSVSLPTPVDISSNPVSIALPTATDIYTTPVSLGFQPQTLNPTLTPTVIAPASPTNTSTITLTGTKQANSYIYINSQLTPAPFASTAWSNPVNLAVEGSNTFTIFARDAAGNQSQTVTATAVRDTTAPVLIVSALSDGNYTNNKTQNISGSAADANLAQVTVAGWPVTLTNGVYSTAFSMTTGANVITVSASDLAGNVTSNTRTIYFDTVPPVITITSPADGSYTNIATATFSGSVDKNATVMVGGVAATMDGDSFTASVDLALGINTIEVVATDLYGNFASQKRTITADNIKPEVAITAPVQDVATNQPTVTITGTVTKAIPVVVTSTFNGVTTPVSVTNGAFSFDVDFSTLGQGTYPITVTVTDAATNVSTATRTIIYDITQPSLTLDQVPAQSSTANLLITGTSEANAAVTVTNQATNVSEAVTVNDGVWSYTVTLDPGPNALVVQEQDAAGNITTRTANTSYLLPAPNLILDPVAPYITVANPVITGTADVGATVNVSVNGNPAVAAAVTGSTWSCSLTGLVQGMNTFTVSAANQFTYTATAIASFALDSIPPAIPGITAPVSPTKSSSVTLTGTKDASSFLYLNNQKTSVSFADTAWNYPINLSEGSNGFSIFARDEAGNQSQSVAIAIIRDTTAPTIATSTPARNAIVTNAAIVSVSPSDATSGSGTDMQASLVGAQITNGSTPVPGSWSVAGSILVFTPQTAPLADGFYTVTLNPVDSLGNTGTASVSFTIDGTSPALQAFAVNPASPVKAGTATFTITFSEVMDRNTQPTVTLNGPVSRTLSGAWQVDGKTWQGSYSFTGTTGDGSYNVAVSGAKDLAGNVMADQVGGTFVLDTVAPVVTLTAPTSAITGNKAPQLAYTVSAGTVVVKVDGAVVNKISGMNLDQLADGAHTVVVQATDAAGNAGSTAVTFTVDTKAPVIASSTPANTVITNNASSVSVTLGDGAGVDLQGSLAGAVVKNSAGVVIAGNWSVSGTAIVFIPLTQLPEGTYAVTIYPADNLGNMGTVSFSFTLDRAPPTVQGLYLSPASPVKAGTVTFTLTFSEAMTTTVQPAVTFTRGLFYSTYALTGSWLDNRTWRSSYPLTADSGDGNYAVTVKGAKDVAGNAMTDQDAANFILDTTPPLTPTVAAVTTPTKVATQTLTGAKPADTSLVINGSVRVPLNSATTWSYGYPLVEGANTLTVVARDAAGNDSPPVTPAPLVALDTTPPQFTIDTYKTPSPTVIQSIGGKKEPGCIVTLNSGTGATTIFDATDQNATWSYAVTLTDGLTNRLAFTAADALGNTTTKSLDILCDTAPPPSLAAGMLVADGNGKGTEVTLTWPSYIELADLAYYRVYYATADYTAVTGLSPVGTVNKGTRTFKVTGLTLGSRYYFAVVPVSVSGNVDATIHTASAVPTDTLAPEDVTGLVAWAGYNATDGNTVSLSWTGSVNAVGDLADQIVHVDAGQGYDSSTAIGRTVTTYTRKGLNDATSYKFKVKTKDALGHESAGTVATAVTRLANPTGLAGVPGSQKVTLTWNAVVSPSLKLYNVYRLQYAATQTDVSAMTLVKSQSGITFTDTGLTNGVTYQYAVTTLNTSGAERTDVQSTAVTPRGDTTGPVVSNVNLAANQVITVPVTISALAADSESAMGRMEVWIDGVLAATQNGGTLSYAWNVVTTIDGNHTVKIAAYDAPGNLTEQIIPVVVSLAPPAKPVITSTFSGPINQKTATITGTAQPGSTVSLRVNGAVVAQQAATAATFTFASVSLAEGDNFVAAKAGNRGGDSPFSADTKVTVVTAAPAAPVNLTAKTLAGGSVQFSWQAGGSGAIGYNLYEGTAAFTAVTDNGVHKTNSAAITYLLKEYIPADDTPHFFTVTALDGAGNESPISNVVSIAADRAAPAANTVSFTDGSGAEAADNTYGVGTVRVAVTVSEALSEAPFFSLEPQNASPLVVALTRTDDTHYSGTFTVDATSANGPTVWKFSGKDLVGNRGNGSGTGPTIDVKGPVATITSPVTSLKTTTGPISVTLVFDEPSTTAPAVTLKASAGGTAQVTGLVSTDGGFHWSGTIDPSPLAGGTGQFLLAGAKDRFGTTGTTIKTGASIILYKTTPPASAVPTGLAAKPGKGGAIALTWTKVADAQGYNVYRQGAADAAPVLISSSATGATVAHNDTPAADGSYAYSVSSLGLLGSESAPCAQVSALSDRTPPAVPTGLALTLTGGGVQATWDGVTAPAEIRASYRLYRAAAPFSDQTGLTPVATVTGTKATDPAPASALRFYAITSVDALGNESTPSSAQEIIFPVAPVANLALTLVDDGKPSLSWTSGETGLAGFTIYRNGSKVNQTPTSSTSYSDGYYSSGAVTYGVSATDSLGHESPVKEVTLPALAIALKDGATMHRGLLENVTLVATIPADATAPVTIDAVAVKIGTLPESTLPGPFTVPAGTPLEITKVAATEANAPPQEAVVVTAIMNPAPGTTVKLAKSSLVSILGSGTALEIFNEPLVRGTAGSVRIKVNNLGSALLSFLTSENSGPTSQVTVYLKDQDGNILAQGNLNQRTGAVVNSGSYATARIEPGGNFLSDPITLAIPASAPYKIVLEAVIGTSFYHYQLADQVAAPGLIQSLDGTIADVSYMAQATTDKAVYKHGEPVLIAGQATSTATGAPMPLVPVRIGVSVNGFDRFFTVTTDGSGAFIYTFTPAANETGSYSVWASHPDLTSRTVQAQFAIIGLSVTPTLANITILKGQLFDLPVTLRNLGGAPLTGLTLTATASSGITANVVNPGAETLAAGETRTVTFRLATAATAPDSGAASLAVAIAEGLSGRIDANVTMVTASPIIDTSPSYIDTGIKRENQRIDSFTIRNTGMGTLKNPRIEGPSIPWLSLTIDKNLGDMPAGQAKSVGVLINPAETVPQGVYNDRLVIYADNHIPYTYNIQVSVTSNAVGSVQFSLLDQLMKQVGGGSITVQNQSVTELLYTLTTAADGTVSLTDIPEGRYSYNITAAGHKPYGGSFIITPGVWTTVPVGLEVNLVQVEWSVTPTTIQDQYQITINQTFETNVPAPVLVTNPPSITLPVMQPGQVFNGEFTVTNHGLIAVDNTQVKFPTSFGDYDVEVLVGVMPKQIGAMQKVAVPYRITRRQTTAIVPDATSKETYLASVCSEVGGYGGGGCLTSFTVWVAGTAVICPNTPQHRTVDIQTPHIVAVPTDCPGGPTGGAGTYVPPPPPPPSYGGGACTNCQNGGGGVPGGSPTQIKTANPCDCKPDETPCPGTGGVCWKDVCRGGTCTHVPDDNQTPPQTAYGDCKKEKCQGGAVVSISDDNDACDDNLFCTSFAGEGGSSGLDKCSGGKCVGKKIEDKQIGPDFTLPLGGQFELTGKAVNYLQRLMSFVPGNPPSPTISYSGSTHAFKRCCEESKDFREGQEVSLGVKVTIPMLAYPLFQQLVPIPIITVPMYVKVAIKIGGEGSGTKKSDDNPCADKCSGSSTVGVSVSGGLSGTIGTPDGIVNPDPLLSLEVSGSVSGGGTVTFPCDGGVEGKICLGKVEAEIKAMATNWTLGAAKVTITEGYCFQ